MIKLRIHCYLFLKWCCQRKSSNRSWRWLLVYLTYFTSITFICIIIYFNLSSDLHVSPIQFSSFINLYGRGWESCLWRVSTVSCFDLSVIAISVTFELLPFVTLFKILLYGLIGIAYCPDFVTNNCSGSLKITTWSFLKSNVILIVLNAFLDNNNSMLFCTKSVFKGAL